jgi:hypothetical protein
MTAERHHSAPGFDSENLVCMGKSIGRSKRLQWRIY